MVEGTALAAARAYGLPAELPRSVRGGSSPLYDVTFADGRRVALRLNGPATDPRAIHDGLRLAETLADAGFATPWPQRTHDGALTVLVAGSAASALQWVPAGPLRGAPDRAQLRGIGALLADFHLTADAVAPDDLHLPDRRPVVPALDDPAFAALTRGADAACAAHAQMPGAIVLDDPGAVLSGADGLWLIGVDRAGVGWRAQDLAAALWPHADAPELAALRDALVTGYVGAGGAAADAASDRIALCLLLRALRAVAADPTDAPARARALALAVGLPG